jgi:hypothetical protein
MTVGLRPEGQSCSLSIVFAFCSRSALRTTLEALPDFPARASELVLYLVAGAGFEPATFGL